MRVNYTIPGLAPPPEPAPAPPASESASFRSRLRRLSHSLPKSWREILRLDVPPAAATLVGPPPRPLHLETRDPARERLRWRGMLDARARTVAAARNEAAPSDLRAVERMLALLEEYRRREDEVVARRLAEPGH